MASTKAETTGNNDCLREEVAGELQKYRQRRIQRYRQVNVLLLTWKEGEATFGAEAEALEEMFHKHFNYTVRPYRIPSTDSQHSLSLHVAQFIKCFGGEDNLIIVYYSGHSDVPQQNESRYSWAALINGGPTLDWSIIQPQFLGAGCDVVIFLDCCYAGQAARGKVLHNVEILAAADKDNWTPKGVGKHPSFTKVLMREMTSMVQQLGVVTLPTLHRELLKLEAGLSRQPLYASMAAEGHPAIVRLTRWETLPSWPDVASQGTGVERLEEKEFLDLRFRFTGPLDSGSTAALVRWMTKGSPSFIYDIEVIERALSDARAANGIADRLVKSDTVLDGGGTIGLPTQAAKEALERLASLNKLILETSSSELKDLQHIQIVENIREDAAAVISAVTDFLASINNKYVQSLRSMDLGSIKDPQSSISMRFTGTQRDGEDHPAPKSITTYTH
ncbi:hypothetical protein GGS23DRAFT_146435 [Durotheca rogersii]|uniref:uncharacterized protein n=1 Tax=Durotheca rogersii TaxID=419775 RepID=UPI00222122B7|nr:uncharacterized protein GGS23DRAFT_146435 [Durotheca rogersii]KAI5861323.1 hypothetical protein GGS23DRAFT_146435 [Durotheca rogersii]